MNNNYLNSLEIESCDLNEFPFSLPLFKNGIKINFDCPITFIVGENGAGKSTLLESLAYNIGFNILGGNRNHLYNDDLNFDNIKLSNKMKLSWRLKTSKGFFFRAESFFNFADYLENMAIENGKGAFSSYGGKSLKKQSHGESFLSLFKNQFRDGIFILDEPESALSAERQLTLISVLNQLVNENHCQFIIATHSPILITCPNSVIYEIEDSGLQQKDYPDTKQFQLYKNFINNPERILNYLLKNED